MPSPPQHSSNNSRMPSNSSSNRSSPMLCPSPTGSAVSQHAAFNNNYSIVSQLQPTSFYQVRSPSISSSTTTVSSSASKILVGGQLPMAPATINIPQPTQPVPTTLATTSTFNVANSAATVMNTNSSAPVQQVPVMQIIQTQSPTGTTRHQPMIMKPIQPKPQQILPKPAGITNQVAYSGGKPVTLAAQRAPATVNLSTTSHQTNPLVIGQGQTIIPNSGMMNHHQGTLLLNQILGLGQNQFISIPSGAGLPPNVQLVMRPQPTQTGAVPASQSSTSLPTASAVNNALLAAFHAQSQAATQQAYMNQNKALSGQGQTVVMQTGQTLRTATPPQLSNATLRPNMMVSQGQPPLVLQQIQGPITVIQALQGANVGVGSTGITLANPTSATGISQLGGILQSAVASSLPQSIVLNNQPCITSVASLINPMGETVNVNVQHLQNHQQQHQQTIVQSQQPQAQPRAQSVNLEELLKQAGIMPDDAPPSPTQPSLSNDVSQVQMEAQQPVYTFTHLPTMSSDCLSMMNGPQTVVMGQEQFQVPTNQSALLTHLQQPMVSSQLQSGSVQTQVKLSLAQDGSVIIQRPVLTQGPALTLGHPNQQNLQPHQVTFSMANLSNVSTGTTTTTATTTSNTHPMQSVVFQSVDGTSQLQSQNAALQTAVHHQQQQMAAAAAASAAASIIPLSLQGINLNLVSGLSTATSYVPTSTMGGVTYTTTPTQQQQPQQLHFQQQQQQQSSLKQPQVVSRSGTPVTMTMTIGPNSVLSQSHPKLVQTLGNEMTVASSASSNPATVTISGNKMIHQNPLLVQTISNRETEAVTSTVPSRTPTPVQALSSDNLPSCVPHSASVLPSVTQPQCSSLPPPAKSPAVLTTGSPVPGLKPGHRIQTIQLSTQGQEELQKVQAQLQVLLQRKTRTHQDLQQIQLLQSEQQKILSQGKVISVHTQPLGQQFTRPPVPSSVEQGRCLQPKISTSSQVQTSSSPVIVSSAHCTNAKSTQNVSSLRAMPTSFQVSSSSATPTSVISSSQPPPHIKIGNQIFTLALAQQQQPGITCIGQQMKPLTSDAQTQHYSNQTKQPLILKIQQPTQQQNIATHGETMVSNVQNINFPSGVAQLQQLNRGVKRPASTPASRSSLIHQRLAADHNAVLSADHRTPFQSQEDAFRRLLPYHVLVGRTMSSSDLQKADNLFESVSEQLLDRVNQLFNKYRYLLLKDSMKCHSISEEVMLERLFMQEEKELLELEKTNVENGKEIDLSIPSFHWKDSIKTEPSYKLGAEVESANVAVVGGEPIRIKQEPVEETVSKEKKNYDEWAEIQKELEMYPMSNEEIGSSTDPVEFEPPSGSTSPVVDFEPPFPKIPKTEMMTFKENCQSNHIQRNHLDNYDTGGYFQSHSHSLRSDTSQWGINDSNRRISHPNNKCSQDENAVLGLEDIAELGVVQDVGTVPKMNHHQTHEDGDSNDMTGLFAAAAAASVENHRSGSVDDDSQDDELSAQVQCAINSILNLQRIDDSCDAYSLPIVDEEYGSVSGAGVADPQNVGKSHLMEESEPEEDDDGSIKNKCSFYGFKREEEEAEIGDEDDDESEAEQQVINYESGNTVVSVQREINYSMDGPSDIDLALDEAVKSILL